MYPLHFKDVALGVLSMYIIVDILLSFSHTNHASIFSTIFNNLSNKDVYIVLAIGVIVGLFIYYFARKSREHFTAVKLNDETLGTKAALRDLNLTPKDRSF